MDILFRSMKGSTCVCPNSGDGVLCCFRLKISFVLFPPSFPAPSVDLFVFRTVHIHTVQLCFSFFLFPCSFFLFPFSFSFLVFVFTMYFLIFFLGWIIYTTGRCRASKGQKTNDGENTRNSTTMNISGHVRDAPQTNAGWAMCMSIRVAQLRTWSPSTHPSTLPRASMENNRPKTATWQYYTIAAILSNPRLPPTFI